MRTIRVSISLIFWILATARVEAIAANLTVDVRSTTQTIAFPARDATLFGYTNSVSNAPLQVQWNQTEGPQPARFSAPWALTTSVSFATTGLYRFSLTVSDGSSAVTSFTSVQVLSAASQTSFYVDPTYDGGDSDGSAQHPWQSLRWSPNGPPWTSINSALASNNVVVYFSARQAASDSTETDTNQIEVWRTDSSANRLTLDGMSKYNTDATNPSWADYYGTNRFQVNVAQGGPLAIGVPMPAIASPAHYTTIRGFDVSGSAGRVSAAGNHTVLEYIHIHDVTTGPAMILPDPAQDDCTPAFGNFHDITFRNNVVERSFGDSIYIGGLRLRPDTCLSWGNAHSDILIEGNRLDQTLPNGGDTDEIFLKAGLTNVTIRRNILTGGDSDSSAIVSLGVIPGSDNNPVTRTNYVIEDNKIFNRQGYALDQLKNQNGTVIRNNLIYNTGSGVGVTGDISDGYPHTYNADLQIYNNTLYGVGISAGNARGVRVRNNIISNVSGTQIDTWDSTSIDSDYNVLVESAYISDEWSEGPHSIYVSESTQLFVSTSNNDFHLVPGSPAVDHGADLREMELSNDPTAVVTTVAASTPKPPSVSAGPNQTITLPATATLSGTASDDGLPGPLTVLWSQVNGPGGTTFGSATSPTTTAAFSQAGTYTLRLTATDTQYFRSNDTTVTVLPMPIPTPVPPPVPPPSNQAPTVNAGPNQTVTLPATATLSGTATDDGLPGPLTVAWTQLSGPGTASIGSASLTTIVNFPATGTYSFRLTASDSQLSSSSDVTVTVLAAPALSLTTHSTRPGSVALLSTFNAISVKASYSDDDNSNNSALVQFRKAGSTTWLNAYTPFIDRRQTLGGIMNNYANQARVSIVGLTPNTLYEVQVLWSDPDGVGTQPSSSSISTWTPTPPTGGSTITVVDDQTLANALNSVSPGQTIHLMPGTYSSFSITRSGSVNAWIKIEGDVAGGTVVRGRGVSQNVLIGASYVIVQHLTLSDSDQSGFVIRRGISNVFVQDNTVQNVSVTCALDPDGHYPDGGVSVGDNVSNVFVLRNRINSTTLSSSSCTSDPVWASPGAGVSWGNATTLVVQENVVTGGFRDAVTADTSQIIAENVDVVGNTVSGYKDDGVESKGTNINVRMWNNRVLADEADTCYASNTNTSTNVYGPIYIFRNVCRVTSANPNGTTIFKMGGAPTYAFHNSTDASLAVYHWDGFVGASNVLVAMNNVTKLSGSGVIYGKDGSVLDYNLWQITSGASLAYNWDGANYDTVSIFQSRVGQELHGKQADARFVDTSLHIDATSPAFDAGVILPNFNDANSAWPYSGSAPDMGAYEYWPIP